MASPNVEIRDRRNILIDRLMLGIKVHNPRVRHKLHPFKCWEWGGSTSGNGRGGGYGILSVNGRTMKTHRIMYTHHFGIIPYRMQIDHTCNNRLCINPDHLQLVTNKKNQKLKHKRVRNA